MKYSLKRLEINKIYKEIIRNKLMILFNALYLLLVLVTLKISNELY